MPRRYYSLIIFLLLIGMFSCSLQIQAASLQFTNKPSILRQPGHPTTLATWEINEEQVLIIHSGLITLDSQQHWPWWQYRHQITKIVIEPQVYPPASMHEFFAYLPQLQEITGLDNLVTDQVTDMSNLFSGDFNLRKLDVSHLVTNQVRDMSYMFANCQNLEQLDLKNFVMQPQTDTLWMFWGMNNLWQLTLGSQVIFTADPHLPPAPGDDRLMPRGSNYNHTCRWQEVGKGQADNPQGPWRTVTNIYSAYRAAAKRRQCTFVWDQNWWAFNNKTKTLTLYQHEIDSQAQDNSYWPWQADYHRSTKIVEIKPGFKIRGSFCALFAGFEAVEHYLGLENLDTSQATDLSYMFYNNAQLQQLDVTHFQTAKVHNFANMFNRASALKHLDVSNFDTSQGKDFHLMFNHMSALQDLDLSSWDLRQAQNTDGLLKNNYQLWKLTLGAEVRFPTNPEIAPAPARKMPLPDNANLISTDPRWQIVGAGDFEHPQGPKLAAEQIWLSYQDDSAPQQSYVWPTQKAGALILKSVPDQLEFGTHTLSSKTCIYYTKNQQSFAVQDTRFDRQEQPPWQLLVSAGPLRQVDHPQRQIMGQTFYYQGQYLGKQQPVILYRQKSQELQSKYQWTFEPAQGIKLIIAPHSVPQPGRYHATLTYELQNTPSD